KPVATSTIHPYLGRLGCWEVQVLRVARRTGLPLPRQRHHLAAGQRWQGLCTRTAVGANAIGAGIHEGLDRDVKVDPELWRIQMAWVDAAWHRIADMFR